MRPAFYFFAQMLFARDHPTPVKQRTSESTGQLHFKDSTEILEYLNIDRKAAHLEVDGRRRVFRFNSDNT